MGFEPISRAAPERDSGRRCSGGRDLGFDLFQSIIEQSIDAPLPIRRKQILRRRLQRVDREIGGEPRERMALATHVRVMLIDLLQLIRNGLDFLQGQGERIAIVLGDPAYYSRFGFSVEQARALESPFPPEAFMALELSAGALKGVRGKVRYPSSFGL